ncbi:hypothetical protein BESB_084480 [Besnoitia besnoiti]|uniref:Metallo-beta-lactamase domain-containing protein n=1 Tax=Besnoitia besnoiti TaxID=94643 RepID=A0A2A9M5M6_BESBE|nr:hypothetical protein BESB_084480 [Besnoitia besnoiti]PFH33249.1 hypothetical protein BESB_084480 [Besnoitia besnoiti]
MTMRNYDFCGSQENAYNPLLSALSVARTAGPVRVTGQVPVVHHGAFQRSTAACARASEKLLDKRLAKDLTGRGRAAGETPCGWCQTPGGKDRLVERVTVPPAPGHQRPVTERGAVDALSLSAGDAASSTPDQSTGVNPCKKRTCAGRRRRAQHGNSDVVNKSSTTRAKRSTSGPKPDRTSNELNAVEKVEAAFADVAEFVRSCTDLRFFDSRPDARDLGAERIRPDGDAFWSDEVRKTDTPPGHTGRSEDEAVSARVAGGRLCQSGRPHTQSGELAGGLPQPVQQAVSKFKNAARGLLGLQTRRQGEEEKQNGSAEANAGADLPGAGGDAAATTGGRNTGKSCVWFDTTKYRLMVDRQELMKELGESSKGSWTLRFLGTGAMQASVTRNTSAILFNRGDGVSWLFDCGGGASAAVIPPMPSSALRSRLSPMLERLASISSVRQDLPDLHSDDGGVLTLGPAKCLNSKMRRLRELALQRKHAAVERLLVQPSYAAALSIAAAAVADRGSGEQVDAADWQAGGGRGMPTSATPQTARKKRVSRIGKIFVTHLHGDHCLGIPSLLSQVAAGAMMQRESAEGDSKVSVRRKRGRESDDTATEQEKNASGPPEGYGPAATMNKAPCGSQPEGRTAGDSFEGIASQHGSTAHSVGGDDMPVVEIFGPEGLRNLLRAIFLGTHVRRCAPYRVHELKGVPCLHHGRRCAHAVLPTLPKVSFEAEGGADLWPAADGSYDVFTDSDIRVLAIPIRHNVPTVGYVVEELGKTRRHLNADALQPIVQRNLDALAGWPALKGQPKAVYQLLSALEPGDSLTFPDGTRVNYDDAFEKEAQHLRKFCICVDTCDASPILPFAKGCDLMVHESTLSEAGLTSDFGLRADEKYDATDDLPPPDEDTCRTRRLAQQSKTEINGSEGVGGNIDKRGLAKSRAAVRTGTKYIPDPYFDAIVNFCITISRVATEKTAGKVDGSSEERRASPDSTTGAQPYVSTQFDHWNRADTLALQVPVCN